MPTYSAGETDTFEGADQYLLQINSGEISVADSKQGATMTNITFSKNDGLIPFITSPPHQRMVVKAVSAADVDIQINEGFKLDLFGFPLLRVQQQFGGSNVNQTVVQIPAENVDKKTQTVQNIGAGVTEIFTFSPGAGFVWEVQLADAIFNDPGGTGTHQVQVKLRDVEQDFVMNLLFGKSNAGAGVIYKNGHFRQADSSQRPPDQGSLQLDVFKGIRLDEESEINFEYSNDTDEACPLATVALWVREIEVAND